MCIYWHFTGVQDKWTSNCSSVSVDALCCCIQTKAHVFNLKPWQADWAHFLFFSKTQTVTHIYLLAAQLNHSFFFSFLATEQLRWSSLGSATEGIKSTRIVAESVLLIQFPQWHFFSSCVRTETSDLQSTFPLLWSLGSRRSLPHIWQRWYWCERFPRFIYCKLIFHFACLSFSHTIVFWVHWQAADQNKGVSHYALFQSIIISMGQKNIITLYGWYEHYAWNKFSPTHRRPELIFGEETNAWWNLEVGLYDEHKNQFKFDWALFDGIY